jgi:hypothetical protein
MLLCAAPAYLRRHGHSRHQPDLASHTCLGFTYGVRRDRWRLLGLQGEEHAVPIRSRFTSNEGEGRMRPAVADATTLGDESRGMNPPSESGESDFGIAEGRICDPEAIDGCFRRPQSFGGEKSSDCNCLKPLAAAA